MGRLSLCLHTTLSRHQQFPSPPTRKKQMPFLFTAGPPPFERAFQTIHCNEISQELYPPPFFWSLETHIFNLTSFVINFRKEHELIHKKGQGKLFWKIKKKSPFFSTNWRNVKRIQAPSDPVSEFSQFHPCNCCKPPTLIWDFIFKGGGGVRRKCVSSPNQNINLAIWPRSPCAPARPLQRSGNKSVIVTLHLNI